MTLVETQVSYDRKHAAWAVKASQSTVDRWVDAGVLHPSVRRSTGSGCGPHLFSPDDIRLAAMLNQFMIPGQKIGHEIRCARYHPDLGERGNPWRRNPTMTHLPCLI